MINIHGIFSETNGWTRHASSFAAAIGHYVPVCLEDWGEPKKRNHCFSHIEGWFSEPPLSGEASFGIGVGPMERMNEIIGKKKIASVVWETSLIPQEKLNFLLNKDQIWTPSQWVNDLLIQNGVDEDLLKVVPEGVDVQFFRPLDLPLKNKDQPFRFLSVGKWEVRKGINDLIHAYCTIFSPKDPVELVLQPFNPYISNYNANGLAKSIHRAYPHHPKITILNPMSDEELVRIYNAVDAFVLPTKAEAWGLPIIEAMACELPVLVTNYSGHKEFVNADTGYLIDVERMIPAQDPDFFDPSFNYGVWAQPSLEHLAHLMRHVVTHPEEAKAKGKQARKELIEKWTWDHAARKSFEALGI